MFTCPDCKNPLFLKLELSNIFGEYSYRIRSTMVKLTVKSLVANDVAVAPVNMICMVCRKTVPMNKVQVTSQFSGRVDSLDQFYILTFRHKQNDNDARVRPTPKVVHEAEVADFEASFPQFNFTKRRLKINFVEDGGQNE